MDPIGLQRMEDNTWTYNGIENVSPMILQWAEITISILNAPKVVQKPLPMRGALLSCAMAILTSYDTELAVLYS